MNQPKKPFITRQVGSLFVFGIIGWLALDAMDHIANSDTRHLVYILMLLTAAVCVAIGIGGTVIASAILANRTIETTTATNTPVTFPTTPSPDPATAPAGAKEG